MSNYFFFVTGSYGFKKALVRFANPSEALVLFLSLSTTSGLLCYFEFVPFFGRFFFGVLGTAIVWSVVQSWLNWKLYQRANHERVVPPDVEE